MALAEPSPSTAVVCSEDVHASNRRGSSHQKESPCVPWDLLVAVRELLAAEVLAEDLVLVLVLVLDQVELHVAEDLVLVQDRQIVAEVEHAEVEHAEVLVQHPPPMTMQACQWQQGWH